VRSALCRARCTAPVGSGTLRATTGLPRQDSCLWFDGRGESSAQRRVSRGEIKRCSGARQSREKCHTWRKRRRHKSSLSDTCSNLIGVPRLAYPHRTTTESAMPDDLRHQSHLSQVLFIVHNREILRYCDIFLRRCATRLKGSIFLRAGGKINMSSVFWLTKDKQNPCCRCLSRSRGSDGPLRGLGSPQKRARSI